MRRIRYRRHPTVELLVVAALFVAGLLSATFIIVARSGTPPKLAEDSPGRWGPQSSGSTASLFDIASVDSKTAWAVGDGGTILHTTDGGETWLPQESGTETTLLKVSFVNAQKGWAVGKLGMIARTSDGGATWQSEIEDLALGLNLVGVSFVDENNGWVITERGSTMLKTEDGGKTWKRQFFDNLSARLDMSFLDSRKGWVLFTDGSLHRTDEGGEAWTHHSGIPGARVGATGAFFLDENIGWVSGWRGRSASFQPGLLLERFMSDGIVARTTDGGRSWTRHDSGTGQFLFDVAFVDARVGWAVGSVGMVLYSDDGGATWMPQPSGTEATLRAVVLTGSTSGWAVGEEGTILKFGPR